MKVPTLPSYASVVSVAKAHNLLLKNAFPIMMRGYENGVKTMFFSLETPKTKEVDEQTVYDFLSLGGGPAGLNGALYAKRKGL